jgi:hypothetical protein
MRVLRIENEFGGGPYNNIRINTSVAWEVINEKHCDEELWPSPYTENITPGLCGFLNEMQLYNWFTEEEIDLLEELGFHLKEIDVPYGYILGVGKNQITFTRD